MRQTTLKQNRVWLFAFADLAFILLISITQYFSLSEQILIEVELPQVKKDNLSKSKDIKTEIEWHLVVNKPLEKRKESVFQLYQTQNKKINTTIPRFNKTDLEIILKEKYDLIHKKPIIVPDANSLTGDLFWATSLIDKYWPQNVSSAIASPERKKVKPISREVK